MQVVAVVADDVVDDVLVVMNIFARCSCFFSRNVSKQFRVSKQVKWKER